MVILSIKLDYLGIRGRDEKSVVIEVARYAGIKPSEGSCGLSLDRNREFSWAHLAYVSDVEISGLHRGDVIEWRHEQIVIRDDCVGFVLGGDQEHTVGWIVTVELLKQGVSRAIEHRSCGRRGRSELKRLISEMLASPVDHRQRGSA